MDIPSPRVEILNEASHIIHNDRNKDYGEPIDDFSLTASLWEAYLRRIMVTRGTETLYLDPHDVAIMMALVKVSRLTETPQKRDHWVDIAGYIGCGWECVEQTYNSGH